MKLRNKKTGEIVDITIIDCGGEIKLRETFSDVEKIYKSLASIYEDWEDAPDDSKDYYYFIDDLGLVSVDKLNSDFMLARERWGNYFVSREEAEKAVEKLKAWKRLKDKGFKFNGVEVFSEGLLEIDGILSALEGIDNVERLKIIDDLDLLFSGDEE